jgi:alpha-tubulin suppressor-like RCC1 family protein
MEGGETDAVSSSTRDKITAPILKTNLSNLVSNSMTELVAWGRNSHESLGMGKSQQQESDLISIQPVPLPALLLEEKISLIACSSRQTIILTFAGSLYSCGDNSEGALGVGDYLPRERFTPINWGDQTPPTIVKVAVGVR